MPSNEPTQQADDTPQWRVYDTVPTGAGREDGVLLPRGSPVSPATLAHALMERGTLDQPEAYRVADVLPRARSAAVFA